MNYAEHGRGGADAQSQGEQGGHGESGATGQRAHGVTNIPLQIIQGTGMTHIAAFLLPPLDAIHCSQGGAARCLGIHARSHFMEGAGLEMEAKLFVQLLFYLRAAENGAQPQPNDGNPAGGHRESGLLQTDDVRDRGRETFPIGGFLLQAPPTGTSERVELGAASEFARLPLGRDPTFLFELVQRRIERSIADLKNIARDLIQTLAHGPPVKRLQGEDFEKQEVQGALHEI